MCDEPVDEIGQDERDAPTGEEDVVPGSGDGDHSTKLKGKCGGQQGVRDRQADFETLAADETKQEYRREPGGEWDGVCTIGEEQQYRCDCQPEPGDGCSMAASLFIGEGLLHDAFPCLLSQVLS